MRLRMNPRCHSWCKAVLCVRKLSSREYLVNGLSSPFNDEISEFVSRVLIFSKFLKMFGSGFYYFPCFDRFGPFSLVKPPLKSSKFSRALRARIFPPGFYYFPNLSKCLSSGFCRGGGILLVSPRYS